MIGAKAFGLRRLKTWAWHTSVGPNTAPAVAASLSHASASGLHGRPRQLDHRPAPRVASGSSTGTPSIAEAHHVPQGPRVSRMGRPVVRPVTG